MEQNRIHGFTAAFPWSSDRNGGKFWIKPNGHGVYTAMTEGGDHDGSYVIEIMLRHVSADGAVTDLGKTTSTPRPGEHGQEAQALEELFGWASGQIAIASFPSERSLDAT